MTTVIEARPEPRASGRGRLLPRGRGPRRVRKPKQPRTPTQLLISFATASVSILSVWFVLFALVLSSSQERHSQRVLYSQFREQLSLQTAPIGGTITPGAPVALLNSAALGLHDAVVVEGTAAVDLMHGPGHCRNSPLPGQAGISVIYGRQSLFGGPFGTIANAQQGDEITVTTGQGVMKYKVERVRHVGDPFSPALADGAGRLTLATAEASGWRNGWAPTRGVYVDAALQGKAVDTPAGRPTAVPKAEQAMRGDVGSLYLLVLWMALAIVAAVGVTWAQDRWGRIETWLVGMPVILAALWGISQTVSQLLPNLM
jgi:sortase A